MRNRLAWLFFFPGSMVFGAARASVDHTLNLAFDSCSSFGSAASCSVFDSVGKDLVLTIPLLQSEYIAGALGSRESISTVQASLHSAFTTALLGRSRTGASFDHASFYFGLTSPIRDVNPYPSQSFSASKEAETYFGGSSGAMFERYGLTVTGDSAVEIYPGPFESYGIGGLLAYLPPFQFSAYFETGTVSGATRQRDSWLGVTGTATYSFTALAAVPEPASGALLLAGVSLTGIVARLRRPSGQRRKIGASAGL